MYIITDRMGSVNLSTGHVEGGSLHPEGVCLEGGVHPGESASGGGLHPGVCLQGGLPTGGSAYGGVVSIQGVCLQEGSAYGGSASGGLHRVGGSASWGGVCIQEGWAKTPTYMGYYGIRSTRGRYASYWNAFLFKVIFWMLPKVHVNCVLVFVTEIDVHSVSPTITVISPALDPRFVPIKYKEK